MSTSLESISNPPISVSNLSGAVGGKPLFQGLTFDVKPREIFGILGRSGSGKSSLLRFLLGLELPTYGQIALFGKNLSAASPAERNQLHRRLGVAFQRGALLSSLTVRENIELPLAYHTNLDKATRRIMVHLKLELMNLTGIDSLMPSELSGGMLKRVSVARAAIMDPELILLDEPTSGLDPANALELTHLLLKLRNTSRATILVISHAIEAILEVADRALVLDEGRIVALGTPSEIRSHPEAAVQSLLGRATAFGKGNADDYLARLVDD